MTGFGRGVAEQGGVRATVDMRAVNHRFLDLKLRGAPLAPALEEAISTRVRGGDRARRGHRLGAPRARRRRRATRIDHAAARAAHIAARRARARRSASPAPISRSCSRSPAWSSPATTTATTIDDAAGARARSTPRSRSSPTMRDGEGQGARARAARAARRARRAARHDRQARGRRPRARAEAAAASGCERLLADEAADKATIAGWLDPARLAQEVALLADRADVTEELVRLASHLEQARALIAGQRRGRPPARLPRPGDRPRAQHDRQQVRGRRRSAPRSSRRRPCSRRCANRSRTWNDGRP